MARKDMDLYYAILEPYAKWDNDEGEERNLEAREALRRFYYALRERKPETQYRMAHDVVHSMYLYRLHLFWKALKEEKYMRACHELGSLMYYEPFFQRRIYYNVLRLLEKYLRIGSSEYD